MCDENILANPKLINNKSKSTPNTLPKIIAEHALSSIGINFGVLAEIKSTFQ